MTRILAIALLMPSALPLAAQPQLDVRFGMLTAATDGTAQFVETSRVPNVVGQAYGWVALIGPRADAVTWVEELTLPASPRIWGVATGDARAAISEDRKTAQMRGVVLPTESEFSNFWSVTDGDPNGRYSLVLKVSDGVVAEFTFDLVPPTN
jgi:hypothetical protein